MSGKICGQETGRCVTVFSQSFWPSTVNVALLTVSPTDRPAPVNSDRPAGARGQPGGRNAAVAPRWTPVKTRPGTASFLERSIMWLYVGFLWSQEAVDVCVSDGGGRTGCNDGRRFEVLQDLHNCCSPH